jgi:hypothetical protein
VLPYAKRHPRLTPSIDCEAVGTGEIEIQDCDLVRATQPDRDPPTNSGTEVTLPRPSSHLNGRANGHVNGGRTGRAPRSAPYTVSPVSPDSSTRIAVSSRHLSVPTPTPTPDRSSRFDSRFDAWATRPPARTETLLPPSSARDMLPSVDDEDMTRLLSYRPHAASPPSSRRPAPWPVAPVMTMDADARARDLPSTIPPPPSSRSLASGGRVLRLTTPPSVGPDTLRPVAFQQESERSSQPPPTSITMRTHVLHGRPTATWAAALVVLGVFVGLGSAVYARGDAGTAAADWLGSAKASAASQPVADSFADRGPSHASPVPASPPSPVAAVPVTPAAPAAAPVADRPVEHAASDHPASEPSDPVAALMQTPSRGEAPKSSRPTFVAPGSYSPPVRHRSHAAAPSVSEAPPALAAAAALPPAPAAQAPLASLAAPAEDKAPAAAPAPPPPPAPKATKGRGKKASEDDMQAASASDALARAQLEAALR